MDSPGLDIERAKALSVFMHAPVGITILRGSNFIVELANATYLELVDRKDAEFVGRPLFDSLPDTRAGVEGILINVLTTGEPFKGNEFEVILNRFGRNEITYFNFVYQPLKEADGSISGIIVVANEVTELVKAKKSVQQSEIQFRNLVTRSPIAMTIFKGKDLIIDIANDTLLRNIWRRDAKDVLGKKLLTVFPELEGQPFPELLRTVLETGIPHQQMEAPAFIGGSDGLKKYFLDFEYAPLTDADDRIYGIMVTVTDVTEKVVSRDQIHDAAERMRLATEGTQLATWDLNLQTREILHSPRLAEIFGFDKSKILGHQEMRDSIHPDDVHSVVEKAFESAMTNGIYIYEARVVHPDGSVHWIRTQGKVIFNEHHMPLRMLGTMMDITDQKLSKQLLEANEERLKIVIEASELGTWELDLKTDKVIFSKRYLEIFGLTEGNFSHKDFLGKIHPDHFDVRTRAFNESMKTGVLFYELPILLADGGTRWIEARGKVFFEQLSGAPLNIIGTLRDITAEKSYHLKIEESERRFRTVADTAPALIWLATSDKLGSFFNKAWLNFTGRTMAEELGNGWMEGVHEEDLQRCLDLYFNSFDKREQFYIEYRLKRHDGDYRWISNNGVPRFTADGIFEGYIGACMDINDRVLFEENLKESESRLRIAALSSELGTWTYLPATNEMTWDAQSRVLFGVDNGVPITVELFLSKIHPDDREEALQKMRLALDHSIADTYDAEYRVIGDYPVSERWIHGKGKAFFDEHNVPYLFSGTVLDITEKRLALKELQEKEARFRLLADSMPQFVWTGDEKVC